MTDYSDKVRGVLADYKQREALHNIAALGVCAVTVALQARKMGWRQALRPRFAWRMTHRELLFAYWQATALTALNGLRATMHVRDLKRRSR
jgi:hypothetical protein